MLKAQFVDLIRKEKTPDRVLRGVKGNKRPPNAVAGGNGTWIIPGEPAAMYLIVRTTSGRGFQNEVQKRVLADANRKRMTEKLFLHVYDVFKKATFEVDEETGLITWDCKL